MIPECCGECPAIFYNLQSGNHVCSVMRGPTGNIYITTNRLKDCPIFVPANRSRLVYGDGLCRDYYEVFE